MLLDNTEINPLILMNKKKQVLLSPHKDGKSSDWKSFQIQQKAGSVDAELNFNAAIFGGEDVKLSLEVLHQMENLTQMMQLIRISMMKVRRSVLSALEQKQAMQM